MSLPVRPGGAKAFSVPFESGHLLGTRVRQDLRDGLVALLHDFSDSGSTYVVPWAMVPRTVVMTWFDGALHSRLTQLTRLSPSVIQDAANDVVAEGGAGDDARQDEMRRRDREEDRKTAMQEVLAARALRQIGISMDALTRGELSREQLDSACVRHGLRSHDLAGTLERLTAVLMPAGIAECLGGTLEGPLRRTLRSLRQFRTHLDRRETGSADRARRAVVCDAADAALNLGGRILARVDEVTAQVAASLARWAALEPELSKWVMQMEMILDGWPQVIAFHVGVIDPPAGAQGSRTAIMATVVPALAKELIGGG